LHSDPKKQKGALRNIQNHINAIGKDNLEIIVVMHGNGLSILLITRSIKGGSQIQKSQCDRSTAGKHR